jgi:hypothetical protein
MVIATKPAVNAPPKTPNPIMELFTPKYVPSKPFGIALKNKTEFAVVNMENPTIIRHIESIANDNSTNPEKALIKNAATSTPRILGKYAKMVDFSSPSLAIIFGATKKIAAIIHVCIKYRVKTVESERFSVLRNGVSVVK